MKIGIAGTGNLAWHLCRIAEKSGYAVSQIWGRKAERARSLAAGVQADHIADPSEFMQDLDIIFLLVNDDAISEVSALCPIGPLLVHCSGSTSIDAIQAERRSVCWPIQSFIKGKNVSYANVPVFMEVESDRVEEKLSDLWKKSGMKVFSADSELRKRIHMAAVFAANFSNHMYTLSSELMKENQLNFDLLKPLIFESVERLRTTPPQLAQTGPALRGDQNTMNRHLQYLIEKPKLSELYKLISESIQEYGKQ
ncbi:MAG: Rossmann-like and DUF2520 domain-containing protein [Flavobacteriales bacterium]|nr:Rossmann-like and DUF2520 domain-containing protein [Flavobacteriales bacterium]